MGIIDEVKNYLEYRKQQSVSPSVPEPIDYYEYSSSWSPSPTESISPSAEYRPSEVYAGPSVALSENVRYSDLSNPSHHHSPNHTMMSYTTRGIGPIDSVFNTETERMPRPVEVKKSPVVKISSERPNRKLDSDK